MLLRGLGCCPILLASACTSSSPPVAIVNTLRDDFDQHIASAVARRGDLVLSANWLSESFEEAETNAIGLAAVLSLMLERLPES